MTALTHGGTIRRPGGIKESPTYSSWRSMRARCGNPNAVGWKYWGGRGIAVCERWESFANFLADMGERPLGTTLDRINNDGNYEPGNCRWATRSEQRANQRDALATCCKHGHEFTPENTFRRKGGWRGCRACERARDRRRYWRNRDAKKEVQS